MGMKTETVIKLLNTWQLAMSQNWQHFTIFRDIWQKIRLPRLPMAKLMPDAKFGGICQIFATFGEKMPFRM